MLRKHFILMTVIVSILLLQIAAMHYPGGSQANKNSVGYDWKNNYICNLFNEKAINGHDSSSRLWAMGAMFLLCMGFAFFFADFSKKITSKAGAGVIKYCGICAMVFAFLIVTPYHDMMITVAGTLSLVSIFYITLFVFKSKLQSLKVLSVVCLLAACCCNYIYYTGHYLEWLPIMQKIALAVTIAWMLALQYFTTINDFQPRRA